MGVKQKKIQNSKWPTQETKIFNYPQFSIFQKKKSGVGPFVSTIN